MEEIMYFQTALVLLSFFSSYTAEGQEAIPDFNRLER